MPDLTQHPSSFRDPNGFLFTHNNNLYRQINQAYRENYDHLMTSGLYKDLTSRGWLIQHEEKDISSLGDDQAYKITAAAAVLLGKGQAQQAQVPHTVKDVAGEFILLVDLLGARRNLLLDEVAHHAAHHVMFFAQLEVHGYASQLWMCRPSLKVRTVVHLEL